MDRFEWSTSVVVTIGVQFIIALCLAAVILTAIGAILKHTSIMAYVVGPVVVIICLLVAAIILNRILR